MIWWKFSYVSSTKKSPSLILSLSLYVCVCVGSHLQGSGNLELCLSPHFLFVQSLQDSPEERLESSQIFLGNAHDLASGCGFLESQEYIGTLFKVLKKHLLSHIFLSHFFFLSQPLVYPSCYVLWGSGLFFTNALEVELFSLRKIRIRLNKDNPWEWHFSRELPDSPKRDNYLGISFWGTPNLFCPSSMTVKLLAFIAIIVSYCSIAKSCPTLLWPHRL